MRVIALVVVVAAAAAAVAAALPAQADIRDRVLAAAEARLANPFAADLGLRQAWGLRSAAASFIDGDLGDGAGGDRRLQLEIAGCSAGDDTGCCGALTQALAQLFTNDDCAAIAELATSVEDALSGQGSVGDVGLTDEVVADACASTCFDTLFDILEPTLAEDPADDGCVAAQGITTLMGLACSPASIVSGDHYCISELVAANGALATADSPDGADADNVALVCSSPCLQSMSTFLVELDPGHDAKTTSEADMMSILCMQDANGDFCITQLASVMGDAFPEGGGPPDFAGLCHPCGRGMYKLVTDQLVAEDMVTGMIMGSIARYGCMEAGDGSMCGGKLFAGIDGAMDAIAANVYGTDIAFDPDEDANYNFLGACGAVAGCSEQTCSEDCKAAAAQLQDEYGCCAYGAMSVAMSAMLGNLAQEEEASGRRLAIEQCSTLDGEFDVHAFSSVVDFQAAVEAMVSVGLDEVNARCSTELPTLVECLPDGADVAVLVANLKYSYLAAKPDVKAAVIGGFRLDLSLLLGLSVEQISDVDVTASEDDGSIFTATITGFTDGETAEAVARLAQLVAGGEMALPNTHKAIPEGDRASAMHDDTAGVSGQETAKPDDFPSGSSRAHAVVAAVVAAAAVAAASVAAMV